MTEKEDLLSEKEKKQIKEITSKFYMQPPLDRLDAFIQDRGSKDPTTILDSFDYIERFMRESKPEMYKIQEERLRKGEIQNIMQSNKSIVGSMFALMIHYIFIINKEVGNIPQDVFITRSKKEVTTDLGDDFRIYIDGEVQAPDCDIAIYKKNTPKVIILSLKTSMRERAGQTFKWKLLLDIANSSDTTLKDKYNISYKGKSMPIICFATSNFYHEINRPQLRGMFKFFDNSFIARPDVDHDLVKGLSSLPDFIKNHLD